MINPELAKVFTRIADLLEIDGADRFRVNSYRRAARSIKDAARDVADLARDGQLTDLPGIGKGAAERITQYVDSGHIDVLDELTAKLPQGLPRLLEIPGLGPKKVAAVYDRLGVASVDDLKARIESGELQQLPGFGATSAKRITEGIAFLESRGGRVRLGEALPIAEDIAERVAKLDDVEQVEIAGSLRRGQETIGDVDILCATANPQHVVEQFVALDIVKRVLASGATKGSVTVESRAGQELQIDLRAVESSSFGAALQYFTGSKEHNVRLREMAVKKGWRLNEYGLYDGEKRIAGTHEEDIYAKLCVRYIPPELREDRGELLTDRPASDADSAQHADFAQLVTTGDLRGDLHMHTVASDGRNTIEEMARAAKQLGYQTIAICDHSKSSTIANGLTIQRMKKHMAAIRTANEMVAGIEILVGCECDILPDGSMDYPDDILAECDWVVASIHSAMGPGGSGGRGASAKLSPTQRTIAAMENPYVSMIGHPTGRLINKRAPMEIDIPAIIETASRTGTFLEVNASFQRLDLKDLHARQAREAGVTLVINTDAHSAEGLGAIRYGVMTARRAGATKSDILNTLTTAALRKRIAAKRKRS